MRKVLIILDCDICHLPFSQLASTAFSDPMYWQAMAHNLEHSAAETGWHSYHGEHHCFECLLEAMHPEEFKRS